MTSGAVLGEGAAIDGVASGDGVEAPVGELGLSDGVV